MTSTVEQVDAGLKHVSGRPAWSMWPVPECPDVPLLGAWQGPWNADVSARPATPITLDMPVQMSAGAPPWDGSTYGYPIQTVDRAPMQGVLDLSRPAVFEWFRILWPTVNVPLPPVLRREGDPNGSSDQHARIVDVGRKVLYELILPSNVWKLQTSMASVAWSAGYPGGGPGVAAWDLSKPWNGKGSGVIAANVPHAPMIARWDEIRAGVINHCLFLALPSSAPGFVGWARGTDGSDRNAQLHLGDIAKLTPMGYERLSRRHAPGSTARVLIEAARKHGAFAGDQTGAGAVIGLTQDRRWYQGDADHDPLGVVDWRLTDFEIIQP